MLACVTIQNPLLRDFNSSGRICLSAFFICLQLSRSCPREGFKGSLFTIHIHQISFRFVKKLPTIAEGIISALKRRVEEIDQKTWDCRIHCMYLDLMYGIKRDWTIKLTIFMLFSSSSFLNDLALQLVFCGIIFGNQYLANVS